MGCRGRRRVPVAVVEKTKEKPGDVLEKAVLEEHVGHCDHLPRERERERESVSERARERETARVREQRDGERERERW